ncbi:hypothetical protein PR048_000104 [Dryococelus australis]|uniref:Uncharacterized protein n=1 Tax=Dryococelus australis TaxID=614101 RepID=A0ABQ9IDQ1_9NEOP|nr:hypothetical protein PR048_000104 [Dryococelus australis]
MRIMSARRSCGTANAFREGLALLAAISQRIAAAPTVHLRPLVHWSQPAIAVFCHGGDMAGTECEDVLGVKTGYRRVRHESGRVMFSPPASVQGRSQHEYVRPPSTDHLDTVSSIMFQPMRLIEVYMERRRNEGAGEMEEPRENPRPATSSGNDQKGDEALDVRVSVARIAPSLLDLTRTVSIHRRSWSGMRVAGPEGRTFHRNRSSTRVVRRHPGCGAGRIPRGGCLGHSRILHTVNRRAKDDTSMRTKCPPARLLPRRSGFNPRSGHSGFSHLGIVPTMPLVGGFSRDSPVSAAPLFRRCSIITSITLIGSQDLDVKSRPNLFTHFTHSLLRC